MLAAALGIPFTAMIAEIVAAAGWEVVLWALLKIVPVAVGVGAGSHLVASALSPTRGTRG